MIQRTVLQQPNVVVPFAKDFQEFIYFSMIHLFLLKVA